MVATYVMELQPKWKTVAHRNAPLMEDGLLGLVGLIVQGLVPVGLK